MLGDSLAQLDGHIGQAHSVVTEVTQDAARAAGAASDAESALLDLAERVKRATGSDPDIDTGYSSAWPLGAKPIAPGWSSFTSLTR